MADTIIVGRFVGVEALAAVGATTSVVFLIMGFTQGLTTGFTVLTAQRFGAGDREGMKKSIRSAVELAARSVPAFAAARMMSYTGVCLANVSAWLAAGVFLWLAYCVLMARMIRSAQTGAPPQTKTGQSRGG